MASLQKIIATGKIPHRENTNPRWMKTKPKLPILRDLESRRQPPRPDMAKVRAALANLTK